MLRNGHKVLKEEVVEASLLHVPGSEFKLNGYPLPVAENYVVFAKDFALIARNPPVVATFHKGDQSETWKTDASTARLRKLLFGSASSRGLRNANRQQPHRHFRRLLDDPSWPAALVNALRGVGFGTQAPIGPHPMPASKRYSTKGPKCG